MALSVRSSFSLSRVTFSSGTRWCKDRMVCECWNVKIKLTKENSHWEKCRIWSLGRLRFRFSIALWIQAALACSGSARKSTAVLDNNVWRRSNINKNKVSFSRNKFWKGLHIWSVLSYFPPFITSSKAMTPSCVLDLSLSPKSRNLVSYCINMRSSSRRDREERIPVLQVIPTPETHSLFDNTLESMFWNFSVCDVDDVARAWSVRKWWKRPSWNRSIEIFCSTWYQSMFCANLHYFLGLSVFAKLINLYAYASSSRRGRRGSPHQWSESWESTITNMASICNFSGGKLRISRKIAPRKSFL